MPRLETYITIRAPIKKVFNALIDPEVISKWLTIHAVSGVKGNPGEKGSSADYSYRVLRLKFKQTMAVLEVNKPRRIVWEMSGSFVGKWVQTLESQQEGTRVDTKVDYIVRGGVIGRMADRLFLQRINQRNLEIGSARLKEVCEQNWMIDWLGGQDPPL